MANIVKIRNVIAYTHANEREECDRCIKLLEANRIPFKLVHLGSTITMKLKVLEHLNAGVYGPEFYQETFTKFPVIVWQECYDDYERFQMVALSAAELATTALIGNPSLVS